MIFTISTKPLKTAISLAVVNKNINKNIQKSAIAQLSMSEKNFRINTEAASISTEVTLFGSGDGDATIFVDAQTFKNLISTIDSTQIKIEFDGDGTDTTFIKVISGASEYIIPRVFDAGKISMKRPMDVSTDGVDLDKSAWKYVSDHFLFALPHEKSAFPVYNNIWVGENGDIIVGDMVESLFVHCAKSNLGATYLLSESIVNLLCSVPDGSKIKKGDDDSYTIAFTSDSFTYLAEFVPKVENDENGNYRSNAILPLLAGSKAQYVDVKVSDISKILSQLKIVAGNEIGITLKLSADEMRFSGKTINASIPAAGNFAEPIERRFKVSLLSGITANLPEDSVRITRAMLKKSDGSEINTGLVFTSGDMTVVCAFMK